MSLDPLSMLFGALGIGAVVLAHHFLTKPKAEVADQQDDRGTPVRETPEGKLFQQLRTTGCPDCGCPTFHEGPSGGVSTNIICAGVLPSGEACGARFNLTPIHDTAIAERIGPVRQSSQEIAA